KAKDHIDVHTDQDKYHVNLDAALKRELFDRLEKEGRAEAMKETQKMPWVRDLARTITLSQSFDVVAKPSLGHDAPNYLLAQAMGERKDVRRTTAIDKDFSIARAPVNTDEKISYPHAREPRSATQASSAMPSRWKSKYSR
ncbi:MAG TPA: hypothetical protein DIW20_09465, partial [Rhodospirillaceae bacterium]|nr:hypothetical protein [Rhodospirillaceae bacterium]